MQPSFCRDLFIGILLKLFWTNLPIQSCTSADAAHLNDAPGTPTLDNPLRWPLMLKLSFIELTFDERRGDRGSGTMFLGGFGSLKVFLCRLYI